MGVAETTGIVFVVALMLQGLFKLGSHLIDKNLETKAENSVTNKELLDALTNRKCGLNNRQAEQLTRLDDLHNRMDVDGTPLWYVPRSWANQQKEIVDAVRGIAETQFKTMSLLEQMQKKLED